MKTHIKFVKKAKMWCKTWFTKDHKTGKETQHIAWFSTREEAEKSDSI